MPDSRMMMAARFMGMGANFGGTGKMEEQAAAEIISEFSRSKKSWPYSKTPLQVFHFIYKM